MVLSGGGARGAYEAGVLAYICGHLQGIGVPFDVLTGSSVGAIHAAFLAGALAHPQPQRVMRTLVDQWRAMRLSETVRVHWRWLLTYAVETLLDRPVRRRADASNSLFDTGFLQRLIVRSVPWQALRRGLRDGVIRGVALPATEVATGRAVVFYDTAPGVPDIDWPHDPNIVGRRQLLGPRHVLASASIPVFFPPVRVGEAVFSDGSLRLNTPLSPALRLGADRLLVLRLRPRSEVVAAVDRSRELLIDDPFYLLGKALDALMQDPIDRDLANLRMINELVVRAEAVSDAALDSVSSAHRGAPFHVVTPLVLSPSVDLSTEAFAALSRIDKLPRLLRRLTRNAETAGPTAIELFSFLLFDGAFTSRLIDIGYEDARSHHDEIAALLTPP